MIDISAFVDCDDLLRALDALAHIGRTPSGGVTRLALSDEEAQARQFVTRRMQEAGLDVRLDAVGNVIGARQGQVTGASAVAAGSHVDTVVDGGRFDGAVGTLAAIEAARAIAQSGASHRHPIEVIVFMGEESARFGAGVLGSRAMVGRIAASDLTGLRDRSGVSFEEALRQTGFDPSRVAEAVRRPGEIKAFLEVHIEQGPVLEECGLPIGVVEVIAAPTVLRVGVRGMAGHAGTIPMRRRRDALVAAALMIVAVERVALGDPTGVAVATVGTVRVVPGVTNVLPGEVLFDVDIRHRDREAKRHVTDTIIREVRTIGAQRGVEVEIELLADEAPVATASEIREAVMSVCSQMHVPYLMMHSGAYHDAMSLAAIASVGMIFIPCREGISHQPGEWAAPEHICLGTQVLAQTTLALAM